MTTRHGGLAHHQAGLTLVEVLVSVIILLVGLLGLAALMSSSQKAEAESYQRAQALLLLQDMVGRINANRAVAACYAITDATLGTPYLGVGADISGLACGVGSATANTRAIQDLAAWSNLLAGAGEISGGVNLGAMVGARGCVTQDDAVNRVYTVSIAWQGLTATKAPDATLNCAQGLYGDEALRRVVSITLRIADLD